MDEPKTKHSGYRPPPRLILTTPVHLLAFGLGAGLSPVAPGTAGTIVAVPLWLALQWLPWPIYLATVAVLFAAGCWICGTSARRLGVHDYGGIVFDEVVGLLATCIPLLPAFGLAHGNQWLWLAVAFALFRLFDIWKPWPIRGFDRSVGGGFGIMLDDVLAAVYAAGVLVVAIRLFAQ
jgi:phosphatidylglycerophosphatase A